MVYKRKRAFSYNYGTRAQLERKIQGSSFAGNAWKKVRSAFSGSKTTPKPPPLTYQRDSTVTYRRRRAPRRVRIRARRFARKRLAGNLKDLKKQTLFYSTHTVTSFAVSTYNLTVGLSIGTGGDSEGSLSSPNSDLLRTVELLRNYYNSGSTLLSSGFKFYVDSMRFEVTIRVIYGTSTTPIYFDVYDFICKRDSPYSVATTYVQGFNISDVLPDAGSISTSNIGAEVPGANPFLQSQFGTYFTVTKCTRYNFDSSTVNGAYVSFERRYNRNMTITSDRIISSSLTTDVWKPALQGVTQGMLIVFRRDDASGLDFPSVSIQTHRTYNIKYLAGNLGTSTRVNVGA